MEETNDKPQATADTVNGQQRLCYRQQLAETLFIIRLINTNLHIIFIKVSST